MKLTAGEAPVPSPVPESAESVPIAESPIPTVETGAVEHAEQKPKKSWSEEEE